MRYVPLGKESRRPAPKPVGVIGGSPTMLQVWTDAGGEVATGGAESRAMLERYAGHVLYSLSGYEPIRIATGHEGWELFRWAKQITVYQQLGGTKVLSSRGLFRGMHPSEAIETLLLIKDQADVWRVRMGSWSSMARQLWKGTIDNPVAFAGRDIMKRGLYGGRKGMRPEYRGVTLENVYQADITGAYPAAMMEAPYPSRMQLSSPSIADEGISQAAVYLPDMPWPALPERMFHEIIKWQGGRDIIGWWPNAELRAAAEGGARVTPLETWQGSRMIEPFNEWGRAVKILRNQPNRAASKWWKGVANSLWGTFSMNAMGGELITLGADGLPVSRRPMYSRKPPMPSASYVASLTTGRVRTRLLAEGLDYGWQRGAVHVDTDGVMLLGWAPLPKGCTDTPELGDWRVQRHMAKVMVKGPQAFAWWDADGLDHVSIAGISGATLSDLTRLGSRADTLIIQARKGKGTDETQMATG